MILIFLGERIAIQGFDPSKGPNLSNFQFQVKPQTLQFQMDPSKLTVLQELPEVGKVYFLDPFEWMLKGPTLISSNLHLLVIKCNCRTYCDNIG